MNKTVLMLAAAGFAAVANPSIAQPNLSPNAVDLGGYQIVADRRAGYVSHIGVQRAEVMGLSAGRSAGVPLRIALRLVAPPGWQIAVSEGVDQGLDVSWGSSATWIQALEAIGKQAGTHATVHWARNLVAIDSLPESARVTDSREIQRVGAMGQERAMSDRISAEETELVLGSMSGSSITDMAVMESKQGLGMAQQAAQLETMRLAETGAPNPSAMPIANPERDLLREIDEFGAGIGAQPSQAYAQSTGAEAPSQLTSYPTLSMFLTEEIQVDITGATFEGAVRAAIPPGWEIDRRLPEKRLQGELVDLTAVDSRGAILNALGVKHGVTLIPFVEFSKVIVTSKE